MHWFTADTGHLTIIILASFAAGWCVGCPSLQPPAHGVLKCTTVHGSLLCTATCYQGFHFTPGQRVLQRTCLLARGQWTESDRLPDCVRSCEDSLVAGAEVWVSSLLTPAGGPGLDHALQPGDVWRPKYDDILQFLQVDLGSVHTVAGWRVRGDGEAGYVRLFRLLFSMDGLVWTPYSDGRVMDKFFMGSFDSGTEVTQLLQRPQEARYVRLNPLAWSSHIALRLDILGCPAHQGPPTMEPTNESEVSCKVPFPPDRGAVNCERNGTSIRCTAYCLGNLVFAHLGPALDLTCDPELGAFSHTPLPQCVDRDAGGIPFVNITGPCLRTEGDCERRANGDYQYCGDCHYFSTCSEGYFFLRPCPEHLHYDTDHDRCDYESSTCDTKRRIRLKDARRLYDAELAAPGIGHTQI